MDQNDKNNKNRRGNRNLLGAVKLVAWALVLTLVFYCTSSYMGSAGKQASNINIEYSDFVAMTEEKQVADVSVDSSEGLLYIVPKDGYVYTAENGTAYTKSTDQDGKAVYAFTDADGKEHTAAFGKLRTAAHGMKHIAPRLVRAVCRIIRPEMAGTARTAAQGDNRRAEGFGCRKKAVEPPDRLRAYLGIGMCHIERAVCGGDFDPVLLCGCADPFRGSVGDEVGAVGKLDLPVGDKSGIGDGGEAELDSGIACGGDYREQHVGTQERIGGTGGEIGGAYAGAGEILCVGHDWLLSMGCEIPSKKSAHPLVIQRKI